MSYSVNGTTITLTRGDTFKAIVSIYNPDSTPYIPIQGDLIRFAMKRDYEDSTPLILKNIPYDTLELEILPNDTKQLSFGTYVYDVQLTKTTGEVDTFITKAKIKLTEEVH